MEPVAAPAAEPNGEKPVVETKADEHYESLTRSIADAGRLVENFSTRIFRADPAYKKKQGFDAGAPGKKQFISMRARITELQKDVDKLHKTHTKKTRAPGSNEKTGFKRLVLVSAELSKFMGLAEWGVMSEAQPDRGVVTHAVVTRYISNYTSLMCLKTSTSSAAWAADEALDKLFSVTKLHDPDSKKTAVIDAWEREGVNRKGASCPDLQKLLKYHMEKLPAGSIEMRKETFYREKSADIGEFGAATKKIFELRRQLTDAEASVEKYNRMWTNCCKKRPKQAITAEYETIVKTAIAECGKIGVEIRKHCDNYGFSYAKEYPHLPKIHDGSQ